ncbi:hypothetical protein AX16_003792 [Volvariella volvacea WC 439]|nr:hypothetical protein AX16_003792 [Volvariella volvacea WC 439]
MPATSPLGLVFAVFVLSKLFRRVFQHTSDVEQLRGPSTRIASWLWGHEALTFQHEATQLYTIWARLFGPVYRVKGALFHPDIAIVTDHAAVQHIFADTELYVKSPAFRPPIANVIGKGIVWAEGEEHRLMRTIFSPAFSQESVRTMSSTAILCAEKLKSRITNRLLANAGKETFNIIEMINACALDIIGLVAYGYEFNAVSQQFGGTGSPEARVILDAALSYVKVGLTNSAFLSPLLVRAIPIITQLPLPLMRAQGAVLTTGRILGRKIIDQEREMDAKSSEAGRTLNNRSILSLLLKSMGDDKKARLTDDQILDNLVTFLMVGYETTAETLSWTLWRLAQNSELQARLREEIVTQGRDLSYDDIQKLSLLDGVVKEGLRLHPASPQTERVALRNAVIPLSQPIQKADGTVIHNLFVKKGQVLRIPFTTMHVNTKVWGPNADVFDPTRWIKPGGVPPPNELPHGWSGLVAFCDGPRNCLGYRFAVLEMKVIIATLIRSLEFRDTGAVIQQKISPTLQPVLNGEAGVLPVEISLIQ